MKILLISFLVFLMGCHPYPAVNKPITLDELKIEVYGQSREIGYTNKQAGFYYTETSADHRNAWQGWHVMSVKILDDYQISVDGKPLKKSDAQFVTVYPHQIKRTYSVGVRETFTMLDSLDALVINLENIKGENLAVAPLLRDSHRSGDYEVKFRDNVLLIAKKRHLSRNARENYPVWIGLSITGRTLQPATVDGSQETAQLFAPASLRSRVEDSKSVAILVAGDTEDETIALAKSVSRDYSGLIDQRKDRMERLLNRSYIRTDNERFDKAMHWAMLSMDGLIMNQVKKGIFAGLPWFSNYWGRDSFISLPGAALVTGNFNDAKEILRSFAEWQEVNPRSDNYGRIPNLVTTTSTSFNTADGTPWFIIALYDCITYSGDTAFARDLFPVVKRSIEGTLRYHTDKSYFLTHGDAETWMDAVGPEGPWSPRGNRANDVQALWFKQLLVGASLAQAAGDNESARHWQGVSESLSMNFQKQFLDQKNRIVYDHLNSDNSPDSQIRPNLLFALDLIQDPAFKQEVFKTVTEKLVYPHGVGSLTRDDENFHPYHHYEPVYVQDAAYHQGIVWTWLAGRWIQAATEFGLPDLAFKVTDNEVHQILDRGAVGTLSELLDAAPRPKENEKEPRLSGTFSQAWSLAEFIRSFYQSYLGITVSSVNREMWLMPRLPHEINTVDCSVAIGDERVSVRFESALKEGRVRVDASNITSSLRITVGWPFENRLGRTCVFTLKPNSAVSLRMTEEGYSVESAKGDSTAVETSLRKIQSYVELSHLALATPVIRPNLKTLQGPSHRLLRNEEIKIPHPQANVVYDVSDPQGDDTGAGSYQYPATDHLKPGSLDITHFTVSADEKNVYFALRFHNLSNPGWHPEYGFQLTYAVITIDKDGITGSGQTVIGRNAKAALPASLAYENIVYVGGGIRVEDSHGNLIAEYAPVVGDEKNPLGDIATKTIEFAIPTEILGTPSTAWRYAVFVGAQDDHGGAGIGDFRSVEANSTEWTGGGKKKPNDPNVYDVIIPH